MNKRGPSPRYEKVPRSPSLPLQTSSSCTAMPPTLTRAKSYLIHDSRHGGIETLAAQHQHIGARCWGPARNDDVTTCLDSIPSHPTPDGHNTATNTISLHLSSTLTHQPVGNAFPLATTCLRDQRSSSYIATVNANLRLPSKRNASLLRTQQQPSEADHPSTENLDLCRHVSVSDMNDPIARQQEQAYTVDAQLGFPTSKILVLWYAHCPHCPLRQPEPKEARSILGISTHEVSSPRPLGKF